MFVSKLTLTYSRRTRQAAIVRGAALRGLVGIAPRKRRCRRHYGFLISRPFQAGIDPAEDAFIDPYDGIKMCKNQMLWLAAKVSNGGGTYAQANEDQGDVITESTSRSHFVNLANRVKETNMTADWQLYSCSKDTAPHRFDYSGMFEAFPRQVATDA